LTRVGVLRALHIPTDRDAPSMRQIEGSTVARKYNLVTRSRKAGTKARPYDGGIQMFDWRRFEVRR
jgi:hypothetical protein